jgi:hypothetical protein
MNSPINQVPELLGALGNWLWGDGKRHVGFSLSRQMYTPANTQAAIPDPHDKPCAGLWPGRPWSRRRGAAERLPRHDRSASRQGMEPPVPQHRGRS